MSQSLKVFVRPTGLHSRAMVRVADALSEFVIPGIEIVNRPDAADLQVLHVISAPDFSKLPDNYAIIQYCLDTTTLGYSDWWPYWKEAWAVWSYYDLIGQTGYTGDNFYHAPLGVDRTFFSQPWAKERSLIITTGFVGKWPAEAIGEVWDAAEACGLPGIHIGPSRVVNVDRQIPAGWRAVHGIDDESLASYYARALYVSGLRYVEGFELPAAEGIACGARAILFDQPATRNWYGACATYVPESVDVELVGHLIELFKKPYTPLRRDSFEHSDIRADFDWSKIVPAFWRAVLNRQKVANRQQETMEVAR